MHKPVTAYANDETPVRKFYNMAEAIRFMSQNRLGPDWATLELPAAASDEDRLLLAAHLCHRALRPQWRRFQLDRLMAGEIRALPDQDWEGLVLPSVMAIRDAFAAAGEEGWSVAIGPISGRRSMDSHAWLEHEDGRALDAFPPFGGPDPALYFESGCINESGYNATTTALEFSAGMAVINCPEDLSETLSRRVFQPNFEFNFAFS